MASGVFISLEGVEGVGKSTALLFIQTLLDQVGIEYVLTREPGGTPLAEKIREILLAQSEETMAENTELLLMFAARSQNVSEVIKPALAAGKWVIADRFTDASFAYQGGGRGMPLASIAMLAKLVQGGLQPDMTLLLDAPVEVGLERIKKRRQQDRIEAEKMDFFERVRQQYLASAKKYPSRFRVIEAGQSLTEVEAQLQRVLAPLIARTQAA